MMLGDWQDRLFAAAYRMRLRTWFSGKQFTGKQRSNHRISNPWHAVSIAPGKRACKAAQAMRDKRALSAEAPRLPLADCEHAGTCACRYEHHADRRGSRRRARDNGFPARVYPGSERRRVARGRRATDGYDTTV